MASTVLGLQAVASVPPLNVRMPSNASMSAAVWAQTCAKWLRRLLWVQMKIRSALPFFLRFWAVQEAKAFNSVWRDTGTSVVSSIKAEARSDNVGFSMAVEGDGDWHEETARVAAKARKPRRKVEPAIMVQRDAF